ncbi:MAG: hypothetical protein ACLQPD_29630 [Desulfomonilaceae bacterium]
MNSPFEQNTHANTRESNETDKELAVDSPCLNTLFPEDRRDLDALFPEPEVKQLFIDISANLKRVSRFVTRMEQDLTSKTSITKGKRQSHC